MKPDNAPEGRQSAARVLERCGLSYQNTYLCPVCRHGQISAIVLMDAFACSFCRHIFTADLRDQSVRVEDSSQPMTWRWNGHAWQATNQMTADLTIMIWLVGTVLVVLPPSLIWISSHMFPPMQGSTWYWFPTIWVALAFLSHFSFVAWLLIEHYQLPFYVTCKVWLRELVGRR
ncbi:MAG: hypothetical protein HC866_00480 [Leptolyngbyaceae cyanobacterium RU_5_1]|nr:hypothetical protein [Leptolyngbyaceae cyanobacterium RU_5_1]